MGFNPGYTVQLTEFIQQIQENLNSSGYRLHRVCSAIPGMNIDAVGYGIEKEIIIDAPDTSNVTIPFYQVGKNALTMVNSTIRRSFMINALPLNNDISQMLMDGSVLGAEASLMRKVEEMYLQTYDNWFIKEIILGKYKTTDDTGAVTESELDGSAFSYSNITGSLIDKSGSSKLTVEVLREAANATFKKFWFKRQSVATGGAYVWFVDSTSFQNLKDSSTTTLDKLGQTQLALILQKIGMPGAVANAIQIENFIIIPVQYGLLTEDATTVTTLLIHPDYIKASVGSFNTRKLPSDANFYDDINQYGVKLAGVRLNEQCVIQVKVKK